MGFSSCDIWLALVVVGLIIIGTKPGKLRKEMLGSEGPMFPPFLFKFDITHTANNRATLHDDVCRLVS